MHSTIIYNYKCKIILATIIITTKNKKIIILLYLIVSFNFIH